MKLKEDLPLGSISLWENKCYDVLSQSFLDQGNDPRLLTKNRQILGNGSVFRWNFMFLFRLFELEFHKIAFKWTQFCCMDFKQSEKGSRNVIFLTKFLCSSYLLSHRNDGHSHHPAMVHNGNNSKKLVLLPMNTMVIKSMFITKTQ